MSAFQKRPQGRPRPLPFYEEDFRLAQLAVPFVVAGIGMSEAFSKAFELLEGAHRHLNRRKWVELMDRVNAHTEGEQGASARLGFIGRRMLKRWLFEAHNATVAAEVWSKTLKGEAVFTPDILRPMIEAQSRANKAKGPRRKTGKAKKSEKKS